jgi:Asp-tRNA(Asn)/Glu-tRNA(Gln) amidotransferase A subunit family amidase
MPAGDSSFRRAAKMLRDLAASNVSAAARAADAIDRNVRDADLKCFIGFDAVLAVSAARTVDVKFAGLPAPLRGVPLAVKDNIDLAGSPTSAGTPALAGSIAVATAPALQRLLDAGAFVLGKANMHELAFGVTSRNAAFGFVRNPADRSRSAGGSSGGCAAAVAAGIVPAALGTDTGGSLRVPAAFCGIVGFRPSTGRYPDGGVVPLAASRDTIGPMARVVGDVALLDSVVTGDGILAVPAPNSIRLGVPRGFLTEDLDPQIGQAWQRCLERLADAGTELVAVDVPGLWDLIDATSPLITRYELRRDLETRILPRAGGMSEAGFVASIASSDVRTLFEMTLDSQGAPSAEDYRRAVQVQLPRMRGLLTDVFATHRLDAWIFPTVPIPPFSLEADREVMLNGSARPLFMTTVRNMQQASLAGMPSVSMPMPRAADALPCGLCAESLPGSDRRLLAVAASIELALSGHCSIEESR